MPQSSSLYRIAVTAGQSLPAPARRRLLQIARTLLADELVTAAQISVAIVDDREIHTINRRFLGHDYPTDVISFLLEEPEPAGRRQQVPKAGRSSRRTDPADSRRGAGKSLEGEIIISDETARRNALRFGWRPLDEMCLYLVHGLLHLCGYDDLTSAELRLMRRREAEILASFELSPRYVETRRS